MSLSSPKVVQAFIDLSALLSFKQLAAGSGSSNKPAINDVSQQDMALQSAVHDSTTASASQPAPSTPPRPTPRRASVSLKRLSATVVQPQEAVEFRKEFGDAFQDSKATPGEATASQQGPSFDAVFGPGSRSSR